MKKIFITTLFVIVFVAVAIAQDSTKTNHSKNKPKATYRVGDANLTVWENTNKNGEKWKNITVEKMYKKNQKWLSSNSFNESELLDLKAAIEKAIIEEGIKTSK
ncbi:MAG: hypothetical protein V4667_09685 [Bacteroidota bacterium]